MSSTAWTANQLLRSPIQRLVQYPDEAPRFNPRPAGVIRPGSTTEAVYELLRSQPHRLFWRRQIIHITGRSRKSVDWACIYLVALKLVETIESDQSPRAGNQRFRLARQPDQARHRGRPRLPDGKRRAKVPIRIREELLPKLVQLGPEWLDQVVEAAELV